MTNFIVYNIADLNVTEWICLFIFTEWAIPFLELGTTACTHLMNDTLSHGDEQPLWNCHVYMDVI